MNKELICYTAGMIDGEGSIQINPSHPGQKKQKHCYFCLTLQVSSTDGKSLRSLRNDWDNIGSWSMYQPKGNGKNQIAYNWRMYSNDAQYVLEKIVPYLRIKKERAKLALEFNKLKVKNIGDRLTEQQKIKRRKVALKLRSLNRRLGKGPELRKSWENVI